MKKIITLVMVFFLGLSVYAHAGTQTIQQVIAEMKAVNAQINALMQAHASPAQLAPLLAESKALNLEYKSLLPR